MKYFIDTEFLEGTQKRRILGIELPEYFDTKPTIDLISIGIVSEDNREYYAISKDFNLEEAWNKLATTTNVDEEPYYWIRENVLKPIYTQYVSGDTKNIFKFSYSTMKWILKTYGKSNKEIAKEVKEFIYEKENILYNHPDCKLKNIGEIKSKIEFYGYYADYDWVVFCQMYGNMMNIPKGFPYYCRDLKQIADSIYESTGKNTKFESLKSEHNALSDARWNYEFYKFLKEL